MAAQFAMEGREPLAGALSATIKVVLPVPKSWPKRKTADALAGKLRPTTKPDADNYAKAALDACNGIVFSDDCQVVDLVVRKLYGTDPKLVIEVEEADKRGKRSNDQ